MCLSNDTQVFSQNSQYKELILFKASSKSW
jgi:hypothetical protein